MNSHNALRKLIVAAIMMSMVVVLSMSAFSIPVPGGHMYLNDVVIVTAAILLEPLPAFLAGGVGAFLGDFFFYPTPMFVSLVVHGLQALVISLLSRKRNMKLSIIGVVIGWIITFVGYSLGRAFIYATPAMAIAKLPFQIIQTAIGSTAAVLLTWKCGLVKVYDREIGK